MTSPHNDPIAPQDLVSARMMNGRSVTPYHVADGSIFYRDTYPEGFIYDVAWCVPMAWWVALPLEQPQ